MENNGSPKNEQLRKSPKFQHDPIRSCWIVGEFHGTSFRCSKTVIQHALTKQ